MRLSGAVAIAAIVVCSGWMYAPRACSQNAYVDLSPQTSPVVNVANTMTGAASMGYYTHGPGAAMRGALVDAFTRSDDRDATAHAALRALTFAPSIAVTRRVEQKFIAELGAKLPAQKPGIQELFDSGVLDATFASLLAKFGYSSDNLADVMTAYVILSWETVHNGDATQHPRGIAAVHRRIRNALASDPRVGAFSDVEKQEFAETLATMAMLDTLARRQLLAGHDTAQLLQLERGVREATLALGIDVGKLQLTDAGFVTTH